jgi:SAM-dependent methyltransferase
MTSASASSRSSLASAYSATAGAWDRGPARIYDRLAEVVVGRSPVAVAGASALDVGAGTGAASRALSQAGAARVAAVDAAVGMLAHDATRRPPAAVADALALPFRSASFDVTVAAFSLNHLAHPEAGLIEAARVTRRGGGVLASAYAADDAHPVKGAVESTLADRGWSPDPWYEAVRREAMPRLATPEGARRTAALAGMDADVLAIRVPFPELDAGGLVAWRMGMAQHAPFVASLAVEERALVVAEAVARLGQGWPPLERSIILVCCRRR